MLWSCGVTTFINWHQYGINHHRSFAVKLCIRWIHAGFDSWSEVCRGSKIRRWYLEAFVEEDRGIQWRSPCAFLKWKDRSHVCEIRRIPRFISRQFEDIRTKLLTGLADGYTRTWLKYYSRTLHSTTIIYYHIIPFRQVWLVTIWSLYKFTAARVPGLNSAWKTEKLCGCGGQRRGPHWRYSCHFWTSCWRHAGDEEQGGKICTMPRPFIPHHKSNPTFNSKFSHGSATCMNMRYETFRKRLEN